MISYVARVPEGIAVELERFIVGTLQVMGIRECEVERWGGTIEINYVAYEALRGISPGVDGHIDSDDCLWVNGLGYQFGLC